MPTWDANTIALDSIEIAPPQSFGMPVMSRPLIERVQMVFTSIDKDKLDRIGALVAG